MIKIDTLFCIDGSGSRNQKVARQKTPIYRFISSDHSVQRVLWDARQSAFEYFKEEAKQAISDGTTMMVAADLPIGVPKQPMDVYKHLDEPSFIKLLESFGKRCHGKEWRDELIASCPAERTPRTPFVSVPGGAEVGEWAGKRKCDYLSNGSSIYPIDNSAKQVGRAALQFWIEILLPLREEFGNQLRIWPFEDAAGGAIVIAECYPRLSQQALYGRIVSKRNPIAVVRALGELRSASRLKLSVDQITWMHAASSEDEFDMFSTAVSLGEWFADGAAPLVVPDDKAVRDLEGWMLGLPIDSKEKPSTKKRPRSKSSDTQSPCPLGCGHVFNGSRGGWDSHVGSFRKHPHWHPEITDKFTRMELFKREFPEFFTD